MPWLTLVLEAALSLVGQLVKTQRAMKLSDNLAVGLLNQAVINLPLGVGVELPEQILPRQVLLGQEARRFKVALAVEQEAQLTPHQLLMLEAQAGHLRESLEEAVQQVRLLQHLQVQAVTVLRALVVKAAAAAVREGQLLAWVALVALEANPLVEVVAVELP
jgi:hypothetical protein